MKTTSKQGKVALAGVNADVKTDEGTKEKRARTTTPPNVRARELKKLNMPWSRSPDAMRGSSLRADNGKNPPGKNHTLDLLVDKIDTLLTDGKWELLEGMLNECETEGLRLNEPPLNELFSTKILMRTAAHLLLISPGRVSASETNVAIKFLKMGCDPNSTDSDGNTLLMRACSAQNLKLVLQILNHCPNVNLDTKNKAGLNAMDLAGPGNTFLKIALAEARTNNASP